MQEKVWQSIEKFHMLPKGAHIAVGVSGGADSVALLHVLHGFSKAQGWSLTAVHVHHGLRGQEADRDRAFVEKLCRDWGIPCHVYCFDVAGEAKKRGLGTEEMGRLLRYEVFEQERKGGWIAVAHNKNDQGETVLMRLCRGAGVGGLTGIPPVRGHIVRPLLYCTRKEIEAYCGEKGLSYCQDSTNQENCYTRNRVRNQILPLLEELYPRAAEHMAETAERMAAEEDYLTACAKKEFSKNVVRRDKNRIVFDVQGLKALHGVMQKRVLAMAFAHLHGKKDVSTVHFQLLEGLLSQESGKRIALPNHLFAQRNYGELLLGEKSEEREGFSYSLPLNEEIFIEEAKISVCAWVSTEKRIENSEETCTKVFDYDKIDCALFCRTRQKGDRLAIGSGRKKIKDFLIDEKIPREERDQLPLIAAEGEILWVVGKRVSAAYQPDGNTKHFLIVQIRRFVEA